MPDLTTLPRTRGCPFDPPDAYQDLARTGPIHRLQFPLGQTGWLVVGHAQAKAVLSDRRFSHRNELLASPLPPPFPLPPDAPAPPAAEPGAFNKMDAPEHTRYRRAVGRHFSPRRAADQEAAITAAAAELLDAMAAGGAPADLVAGFARPLPARAVFDLLGIPEEVRRPLHDNLDVIMHLSLTLAELTAAAETVGAILDSVVAAELRGSGDGGGVLADLAGSGELDATELRNIAWALVGGGTDTTSNMIAFGVLALLEHPGQLAKLRADPALLDNAIEELLRYLTISQFGASRCALEDVPIGGELVRKGETVVVALPAANRDTGSFAAPGVLDVSRDPRGHLAFGHGVHKCIGQHLARVTLRAAYTALLDRFGGLRLAVPLSQLRMRDDMDHYGVHELPVAW
ncbi:cytochrome P450 [Streptomonospora sediminis]